MSDKQKKQWFVPKKDYPRQQGREIEFIRFLKTMFREFWELMKLNFLFLLTCLGVVTIPAAITARHYITLTMYRDKNHFLWRDYMKAFKTDFWRSLLGGVVFAIEGNIKKVSDATYIVTPKNVDVSAEAAAQPEEPKSRELF